MKATPPNFTAQILITQINSYWAASSVELAINLIECVVIALLNLQWRKMDKSKKMTFSVEVALSNQICQLIMKN